MTKESKMITLPIDETVVLPDGRKLANGAPPPNARPDLKIGDPDWPAATYGDIIATMLMDMPAGDAMARAKQFRMSQRILSTSDKLHLRADKVQELVDYLTGLPNDSNYAHPAWQGSALVWLEKHLGHGPPEDEPW